MKNIITEENILKVLSEHINKNTMGKNTPEALLVNMDVYETFTSVLEALAIREGKWRGYHMWVSKEYMDKGYDHYLYHGVPVCNVPDQEEDIIVQEKTK